MHPQVELENISKHFGGVAALKNVSLELHAGQVHCLAGENGSGKSTLIKVLAGVHQSDEGVIRVDGRSISQLTPIESVQRGIQVIYQDFSLFANLTVQENLSLNSQIERCARLINRKRMRQIARLALERLGVDLPLDVIAGQLSTAQKQLVAIARALVQDARLIILDEPTTALTHIEVERLFDIVRKLKQNGVAILFVSHKLREMQEISDAFTILRNGEVVATGPAEEFSPSRITHLMTGRNISSQSRKRPKVYHSNVLLKAEHLTSSVIKDVSLTIHEGEIVGLTGLMGSGQTDLALALFGLQYCHSGTVTVLGFQKPIKSIDDALAAGIAYVPEDRLTEGLFLDQSIENNLVAADMDSVQTTGGFIGPRRIASHAEHWLNEMDVQTSSSKVPVRTLSGGNQQRIVLAKWLSRNPRVLILNGPTVGVDVGSKEKLHEKLHQLAEAGMAVLMISDDLPELVQNCDRVHIIHRGKLVQEVAGEMLSEATITHYLNELE